jgi:hypothetical protein
VTLPASIRVNVRASFPSLVGGAAFISVNKSNGIWSITPNYLLLAQAPALTSSMVIAVQDQLTGVFSYVPASSLASNTGYRIVTTVGSVSVLSTDTVILLQKSPSGPSTLNLPPSASRSGVPIIIKDITGDANTNNDTIVPAAGETIDGLSAAAAAANGIAVIDVDYGSRTLYPLTSGGWYSL